MARRSGLVLLLAILAPLAVAHADTPPWGGVWLGAPPPDDDGDPPPITYLPAAGAAVPVAHGLPFGLNLGTCDRGRVSGESPIVGGGELAQGMDARDQECLAAALAYLPDQRSIAWAGGDGVAYRVTALRTWMSPGGRCREIEAQTLDRGQFHQVRGVVCRRDGGQWALAD